jgi:hypothetical protein
VSNSDYKIKYVAPSKRHALALNSQTFIPIELNSKKGLTEPDDYLYVVNSIQQTDIERNEILKYRINGKIEIVTDNTIIDTWSSVPLGNDVWSPEELDQSFLPRTWLLQITYPFSSNDTKKIITLGREEPQNTTEANRGFQIKELLPYNYTTGTVNILVRTSQKHGIKNTDEFLYMSPTSNFISDGVNTVNYLGFHRILDFEAGNEDYGLILETEYITPTTTVSGPPGAPQNVPIQIPFFATGKRVFEPSLNDFSFSNSIATSQIQRCDANGQQTGTTLEYIKIFSQGHTLRVNDFVEVRVGTTTSNVVIDKLNNLYKVVSTPTLDTFVIKYDFTPQGNTLNLINYSLLYKYLDGVPSEYYFRQFKIITEPKDYEVYRASFSTNIFNDNALNKVFLFHFNKDIDVSGLRDNLGRPISDLFLTVVKRSSSVANGYDGYFNWSETLQIMDHNRLTTNLTTTSGFNLETYSDLEFNFSGTSGTYKTINDVYNYCDFVEYNRAFLDETVLSETLGRFAPKQVYFNDTTNPDPNNVTYNFYDGYTYKIHHKIKIREFSDVIETVDNKDDEIFPDYVQINNDGTVSWRDLLDIGVFEGSNDKIGVDYPFVNSAHYLFGNYPIYIRKQLATNIIQDRINLTSFVKFDTNRTPNDEC